MLFLTYVLVGYFGAAVFMGSKTYPALRPMQREMKGLSKKICLPTTCHVRFHPTGRSTAPPHATN